MQKKNFGDRKKRQGEVKNRSFPRGEGLKATEIERGFTLIEGTTRDIHHVTCAKRESWDLRDIFFR